MPDLITDLREKGVQASVLRYGDYIVTQVIVVMMSTIAKRTCIENYYFTKAQCLELFNYKYTQCLCLGPGTQLASLVGV